MSLRKGLHSERDSGKLEALFGAALFLGSAAWVIWQNGRVAVLWDLSYLLDSAWRFSLGQLPYRDIPFAHPPLTFLIQAALMRVFGRAYWPHVAYAALAGGLATVLTWRLVRWVVRPGGRRDEVLAGLLAVPLVPLGIYGVYPHPIYDSDCILACLFSLLLLSRYSGDGEVETGSAGCVLAGVSCAVPIFVKQNIGLPFFAAVLAGLSAVAMGRVLAGLRCRREMLVMSGAAGGLGLGILALQITVGVGSYVHWTVQFAAQRRLPGMGALVAAYRQELLVWAVPCVLVGAWLLQRRSLKQLWAPWLGTLLLSAPLLWTAARFVMEDSPEDRADQLLALWPLTLLLAAASIVVQLRRRPTLRSVMPWILLVIVHGAFLSQQLWGSTYACWPVLILLIAGLIVPFRQARLPLAAVVSGALLVCGGWYAASLERLSYIQLEGAMASSSIPTLRGLATRGPWLPALDELVRFTDEAIPKDAGVLLIPGEDPFFFATGRVPRFPALLFDPATFPYGPEETASLVRARNIEWLVIKRETQLTAAPYDALPAITAAVMQDFTLYRRLALYDVYRRK